MRSDTRPLLRWWWPGGRVDETILRDELKRFQKLGFGGVEVQAFSLGVEPDLRPGEFVGDRRFRKALAFAEAQARRHGLSFHSTASSGWPLATDRPEDAEMEARAHPLNESVEPEEYRRVLQARFGLFDDDDPDERSVARVKCNDTTAVSLSRVGRLPMGCAIGKRVWAVDHLSTTAVRSAFRISSRCVHPRSVNILVDSFEMGGHLPISRSFLKRFREIEGYDLTPLLPFVILREGEFKYHDMLRAGIRMAIRRPLSTVASMLTRRTTTMPLSQLPLLLRPSTFEREYSLDPAQRARTRRDYERVRARLFHEFVSSYVDLAHRSGHRVRLQAHGGYGHPVDTYALGDVPETETLFGASSHEFMLLAASAAWLSAKPYASCECMIALGVEVLTEADMLRLATRSIVAGADQLVFHGMPYPVERDGQAWYPFAPTQALGGVAMSSDLSRLSDATLGRVTAFSTRVTALMRQGRPHVDVLWVADASRFGDAPTWAWDQLRPHPHESSVARELRARGIVYAVCSPNMLKKGRVDARKRIVIGHLMVGAIVADDGCVGNSTRRRLEAGGVRVLSSASPEEWPSTGGVGATADMLLRARTLRRGRMRVMCVNDATNSVRINLVPLRLHAAHRAVYDPSSGSLTVDSEGSVVFDLAAESKIMRASNDGSTSFSRQDERL